MLYGVLYILYIYYIIGSGTLFSIDLLDAEQTAIRATFFKNACDRFFPLLSEGNVYYFSGGKLKASTNSQYSSIKNNYELTFDERSDIIECFDVSDIKEIPLEFVSIMDIQNKEVNAMIDILVIIKHASDVSTIISQKQGGKELFKRELTLIDASNAEIRLTIWGEKATQEPVMVVVL